MKDDGLNSLLRIMGVEPDKPMPVVPVLRRITTLSSLIGLEAPPIPPPVPALTSLSSLLGATVTRPVVPSLPAPIGIKFQETYFSEPKPMGSTWLPTHAGIYAVLVFDFKEKPRPYRVLYFGKAENLAARVTTSHEKYSEWCRAGGGAARLYVASHTMRNSHDWQRSELERNLIKAYVPQCNETFNPFCGSLGSF
jgi:hypothetical protein